ncbi:hypothetical protein VL10_14650 [Leclercia adecarboxylata]|nr:hypothetical protein VL10_14650 [Leclercia adecarboxylata]KMN63676.1 hypothetical protein VK95_18425 [Leclercia sp. LK8]
MMLFKTGYTCKFSKITFQTIIDRLNEGRESDSYSDEKYVAFVDGDSSNTYNILKNVYDMKKEGMSIYVIILTSKGANYSSIIKQLSDFVLSKKVTSTELENIVRTFLYTEPRVLVDDVFGDFWDIFFKAANKESQVMKLLIEGHSHSEVAKLLHLSVKTVSAYKIKAVKKHGVRNFNELYIKKLSQKTSDV